jgi:hypothetical protein
MPSNTCCGVESKRSVEAAVSVPKHIAVAIVILVSGKQILIGFTTPVFKKEDRVRDEKWLPVMAHPIAQFALEERPRR